LGVARDYQEARVVFLLVGDAALEHLETMPPRRLSTGDGRLRRVAVAHHLGYRHRGVGVRLDVALGERGEELATLRQRLRVGGDAPHLRHGNRLQRDQTVLDAEHLLADGGDLRMKEHVVGLVDGTGSGVLHRKHGVVELVPLDRVGELLKRPVATTIQRLASVGEVLEGSQVAVGAGAALVADAQPLFGCAVVAAGAAGLPIDGMLDDLAEQRGDVLGLEPSLACTTLGAREDLVLAKLIALPGFFFALRSDDLGDQVVPCRERVDNALVGVVERGANLLQ